MFETDGLTELAGKHRNTIRDLDAVGEALKARFFEMDDAIDCLLLAALTGEAMVMIGPPGTAKSRLIRAFCNLLGLVDDESLTNETENRASGTMATKLTVREDYFEYLLTQFTEPSELFGFYDLAQLESKGLVRKSENMMQQAQVVFLDEIFNASSAILNSLLTFLNERRLHDRGEIFATPLQLLFAASNQPPDDPALVAVYDRFLLRCWMRNVAQSSVERNDLAGLIELGWCETHATELDHREEWSDLLTRLASLRNDIDAMTRSGQLKIDTAHPIFSKLADLVRSMVKHDLSEMSNRRLVKFTGLVLAMRLLSAHRNDLHTVAIESDDLDVILRFSLDRDDPATVVKIRRGLEPGGRNR